VVVLEENEGGNLLLLLTRGCCPQPLTASRAGVLFRALLWLCVVVAGARLRWAVAGGARASMKFFTAGALVQLPALS